MNKLLKSALSMLLVLSLIMLLFGVTVSAQIKDYLRTLESFDGNEWTVGTTSATSSSLNGLHVGGGSAYTISNESDRGKVISFGANAPLGINSPNQKWVQMKFDIKVSTAQGVVPFNIRGSTSTGNISTAARIRNGYLQVNGTDRHEIVANEWYTMTFTLDYENNKFDFLSVDSSGQTLYNETELSLGSTIATYKYVRILPNSSYTGTVYVDNLSFIEKVDWPEIASVKDSTGSTTIDYTGNTVIVETTQNLIETETGTGKIDKNLISITGIKDNESLKIENAALSGNKITITLGSPLKSSSDYKLILSKDIKMEYGSLPLGEDITATFTTSSRPLDITDVSFTSDGNNVSYEVSLANTTGSNQNIVVIASSYDESGRLTQTVFQPVTVGYEAPIVKPQGTLTVPENGSVKVFAITDFASLKNLNNSIYTYSLN